MALEPTTHAQVIIPYASGLPEDVSINTFEFDDSSVTPETAEAATNAICLALVHFYNNTFTDSEPISNWMAGFLDHSLNACRIMLFHSDTPNGVQTPNPFTPQTFTLGEPATDTSLPLEVAVVGSVIGDGAGVPIRRRRGRRYIGPLNFSVTGAGSGPLVDPEVLASINDASLHLQGEAALNDTPWCVWSRVDDALYPISGGFTNNEFDTQRRRGIEATARQSWSV